MTAEIIEGSFDNARRYRGRPYRCPACGYVVLQVDAGNGRLIAVQPCMLNVFLPVRNLLGPDGVPVMIEDVAGFVKNNQLVSTPNAMIPHNAVCHELAVLLGEPCAPLEILLAGAPPPCAACSHPWTDHAKLGEPVVKGCNVEGCGCGQWVEVVGPQAVPDPEVPHAG